MFVEHLEWNSQTQMRAMLCPGNQELKPPQPQVGPVFVAQERGLMFSLRGYRYHSQVEVGVNSKETQNNTGL